MIINPFDLILGLCLGYGFVQGFRKGLLIELASLIALVLGLWGAFLFADLAKSQLELYATLNPVLLNTISYLLVFIIIVFGVSFVAKILTKIIKLVALGLLNRITGAIFGILKIGVFLSATLLAIEQVNVMITLLDSEMIAGSFLYTPLLEMGDFLFDWIFDSKEKYFSDSII